MIGTWKQNFDKSQVDAGIRAGFPVPRDQTEVYRLLADGRMELVITQMSEGKASTLTFHWPLQGGATEGDMAPGFSSISSVVAPGDFYVTYLLNGQASRARGQSALCWRKAQGPITGIQ